MAMTKAQQRSAQIIASMNDRKNREDGEAAVAAALLAGDTVTNTTLVDDGLGTPPRVVQQTTEVKPPAPDEKPRVAVAYMVRQAATVGLDCGPLQLRAGQRFDVSEHAALICDLTRIGFDLIPLYE